MGTTHPLEIELLERADPGREFACVMYALGLAATIASKLRILDFSPAAIVRPEMIDFMRAKRRLKTIDRREATDGAVVIYFVGVHVGRDLQCFDLRTADARIDDGETGVGPAS